MKGRLPGSVSLIRQVVEAASPGAINLALGVPGHATPAPVVQTLKRVAGRPLSYTTNAGISELRSAVARLRPHHGLDGSSVLVTVGSQEALALAILGLCRPGDEVLIPRFAYPSYEALSQFKGAKVVRAAPEEMPGRISGRTRLVIVASPSNPTGEVLSSDLLEELSERAAARSAYLLSDEVYHDLSFGSSPPEWPRGRSVLHVGSLSKSLALTGWRIGWLIASPELIQYFLPLHQHLVTCAPTPSQHAALTGLNLISEQLTPIRTRYARNWTQVRKSLETIRGLHWIEPRGGFYVFVRVSERVQHPTLDWTLNLAREGQLILAPGEAFGPDGSGWVRVSFSSPTGVLAEGMRRFKKALQELPRR